MATSKADLARQMIEGRIAHADYVLEGLPAERELAQQLGLSRATVRTALQDLTRDGTLNRHDNGRLHIAASGAAQKAIGFAALVRPSPDVELWRDGVTGALEGREALFRSVAFAHWDDAILADAIARFDGLFLVPPSEGIPTRIARKMRTARCRVVVLDQNECEAGLPSATMFPPASLTKLFDHLVALGHARIDCLNTQAPDSQIRGRIAAWRAFTHERGIGGCLRTKSEKKPILSAYEMVRAALEEGRPLASALFCTTGPAALGAMRALHEAGLQIGRDISVAAINSEGLGRFLCPSLTALEAPPRALVLRRAVEWMLGDDEWSGPLHLQPDDAPLFQGESTGSAPASPLVFTPRSTQASPF